MPACTNNNTVRLNFNQLTQVQAWAVFLPGWSLFSKDLGYFSRAFWPWNFAFRQMLCHCTGYVWRQAMLACHAVTCKQYSPLSVVLTLLDLRLEPMYSRLDVIIDSLGYKLYTVTSSTLHCFTSPYKQQVSMTGPLMVLLFRHSVKSLNVQDERLATSP